MIGVAEEENTKLAYADLDHIAKNIYALCETQNDLIQANVNYSLNVAREVLHNIGTVGFTEESVTWNAVNQYTKNASNIDLPEMVVGQTWLGQ